VENTDTNNKDGNVALLQSPDNICVTENFIYFQEDPNSVEINAAYIYQSNLLVKRRTKTHKRH
jgi:hypothetical protein